MIHNIHEDILKFFWTLCRPESNRSLYVSYDNKISLRLNFHTPQILVVIEEVALFEANYTKKLEICNHFFRFIISLIMAHICAYISNNGRFK